MIDSNYLSKDYGLLNSTYGRDVTDENAPLYSVEYYLLLFCKDLDSIKISDHLFSFYNICWTRTKGLYNQRPNNNGSKEDYMSPDQLIAMVAYHNKQLGHSGIVDYVWKYLWTHLFTYDNLSGRINFKRLMQPMAISFVAYSATGSWFWKQVLLWSCRKSCREFEKEEEDIKKIKIKLEMMFGERDRSGLDGTNKESSGVLKAFVCLRSLGIKDEYCEQWYTRAFEVYFPDENHPIRKVLNSGK